MGGPGVFAQEERRYVAIGLDRLTVSAAKRQRNWWRRNHDDSRDLELARDEVPCRNPDCDKRMRWGERAWGVYLRNKLTGRTFVALFHSERCHDTFLARFFGRHH